MDTIITDATTAMEQMLLLQQLLLAGQAASLFSTFRMDKADMATDDMFYKKNTSGAHCALWKEPRLCVLIYVCIVDTKP